MSRSQKLLFYYSFVTALFITISGVLSSENLSMILLQLIFLPVTIYFCYQLLFMVVNSQDKLKTKKKSKISRSAIIITLVIFLLLLTSALFKVNKPKLGKIKSTGTPILKTKLKPTPTFFLILKQEFTQDKINIREEASLSAKIIGNMQSEVKYPLIKHQNQWYQIRIDQDRLGFVNQEFVKIAP